MLKRQFFFILILLVIIFFGFIVYSLLAPAKSPQPSVTDQTNTSGNNSGQTSTTGTDTTAWVKEFDAVSGIHFSHPAHFFDTSATVPDGTQPQFVIAKPITIGVGAGGLYDNMTFQSILLTHTYMDGSGANPSSMAAFSQQKFGAYTFYYMQTGRYEGTISYQAYFQQGKIVYPISFSWYVGAKWSDQSYVTTTDPTLATFKQILASVSLK
jgi:hypothetical protein